MCSSCSMLVNVHKHQIKSYIFQPLMSFCYREMGLWECELKTNYFLDCCGTTGAVDVVRYLEILFADIKYCTCLLSINVNFE